MSYITRVAHLLVQRAKMTRQGLLNGRGRSYYYYYFFIYLVETPYAFISTFSIMFVLCTLPIWQTLIRV